MTIGAFVVDRDVKGAEVDDLKGVRNGNGNHTSSVEPEGDFKPLFGFL